MSSDIQVAKEHYDLNYDHKARWLSYWYQIQSVCSLKPTTVLEIGCGNNMVRNYLARQGIAITTLDIDEQLKPNLVGSITDIPSASNSYDVVLCSQVLEHLPYENTMRALLEIYRVAKYGAVISVPDSRITLFKAGLHIPTVGWKDFFYKIASWKFHTFDGQHYWEIGKRGYSLKRFIHAIERAGFVVVKHFVPADVPTKHFFILSKKVRI